MKTKYFDCLCGSANHVIRFIYDEHDLWLEVQLNPILPFWQRVWVAIKYIFGFKVKYGHWDVTLIKDDDKQAIIDLIKESIVED